jgi:hypothetical protein
MAAFTWTGVAPGAVTIVNPKPIEPSGFGYAKPTTLALTVAPHWSSWPSNWYWPPCWTTASVTMLQYGCNCQR